MRVAALDCGTNSLRLLVADLDGRSKHDVRREMRIVRLGEGVDRTGVLSPAALERTRAVLEQYGCWCTELGVERTRMVATSASRDAANAGELVLMVRATLGVDPEVVTGDEEATLSFDGATRGLHEAPGPFLVVDIGGGSTEFVLGTSAVVAACSVDIGCVRLTERHLSPAAGGPYPDPLVGALVADVHRGLVTVSETLDVTRARTLVAVAGTATTVAAIALDLPAYDAERLHLSRIGAGEVDAVAARLVASTSRERAAIGSMHPGRVDVITAGSLVLREVVRATGLDSVVVSEHDILDGVAASLLDSL